MNVSELITKLNTLSENESDDLRVKVKEQFCDNYNYFDIEDIYIYNGFVVIE